MPITPLINTASSWYTLHDYSEGGEGISMETLNRSVDTEGAVRSAQQYAEATDQRRYDDDLNAALAIPSPEPVSRYNDVSLNEIFERTYGNLNIEDSPWISTIPPLPISRGSGFDVGIGIRSGTRTGRREQTCPPPSTDTTIQNMERIVARIQESVCTLEMYGEENFTSATTADIGTLCATINRLRNRLWKMHDKLSERRTELRLREAE